MICKKHLTIDLEEYRQAHRSLVSDTSQQIDCNHLLSDFRTHELAEQSGIAQVNRIDTKYVLPVTFLEELLQTLKEEYSVLQFEGQRCRAYETTYFDTPNRAFYQTHHNGKLNRYKVRYRRYPASDSGFFEIKKKNNKSRTIKKRISLSMNSDAELEANTFCQSLLGDATDGLERKAPRGARSSAHSEHQSSGPIISTTFPPM